MPCLARKVRSGLRPWSISPPGNGTIAETVAETTQAIADGADEIDLVIPYKGLMDGDERSVTAMVAAVRGRAILPPVRLKVILETGEIRDPALIRKAADLAIAAGADFIKTSTGKTPGNATEEAAEIMLNAIKASGQARWPEALRRHRFGCRLPDVT